MVYTKSLSMPISTCKRERAIIHNRSIIGIILPCPQGETCVDYGTSPYAGMVNFDNLLWSLLTLFTVTTLEGWSKVTNVCGWLAIRC